jgi:N-acetylmuramoyl-L-alanine amidase
MQSKCFLRLLLFFSFCICFSCTRRPVEKAPLPSVGRTPLVVIIDPGHGGENDGTKRKKFPFLVEKDLALKCALIVRECLEQWGYDVLLTRTKDQFITLSDRTDFAKKWRARVFVSIHFNHAPNQNAEGVEVFYYPKSAQGEPSKKLGFSVLQSVLAQTKAQNRGVKAGNFHVLRENPLTAILIEGGFFSNTQEAKKLASAKYLRKLSLGIAKGIDEFCRSNK